MLVFLLCWSAVLLPHAACASHSKANDQLPGTLLSGDNTSGWRCESGPDGVNACTVHGTNNTLFTSDQQQPWGSSTSVTVTGSGSQDVVQLQPGDSQQPTLPANCTFRNLRLTNVTFKASMSALGQATNGLLNLNMDGMVQLNGAQLLLQDVELAMFDCSEWEMFRSSVCNDTVSNTTTAGDSSSSSSSSSSSGPGVSAVFPGSARVGTRHGSACVLKW